MGKEKPNSAERVLRIIKVLQHNSFTGLANKELAEALDESPANITRTLDVLIREGFVIKLDTGKFAFSPLLAQIAMRHSVNMDKASHHIQELKQRVETAMYS
ncbi:MULTISPECIES: helix-turn-helix domain-containing protein [Pasteurella]|uniref:Helix-turn-helix domain-containing protein n=1 Tax=Pasteurella oralis TaxID=1071947 RepID=A0ABW4NVK9_9PAST|nr:MULTISPECIES: helix-turn-helix domain-containing protein [Pasteurella]MCL7758070.1 helix-turn-helix domain-containing protein [Pasteurella multocida]MCL7841650.1 helix-turn-helix domain-containing protein [Pasteurella multocida]MCT8984058.1 helix-turn-helix domain-containing protein [Pasteurella multocida]MDG2541013.1 helix-turn-helix domain-containing protein [Pasteurella multocida]MDY0670101.1 helix-turn-helix domain-containing protein [Pasteurella multocida]